MIIKNEEDNLKLSLDKIRPFVSEIIIVDTGSTDKSISIAKEFTEKVYNFSWCNDFSKARNFSLQQATNDWVLVLDADEYVLQFNVSSIHEFINNRNTLNEVGRINRINSVEDSYGNRKYIERVNRFFNKQYYHYEGIIHEQIIANCDKTYMTREVDITVEHIGYTEQALRRTNKISRNIDLLNEALKDEPEDPYLYYQLGKSYFMLKDNRAASMHFEKALSFRFNLNFEYASDLIETYGYSLINSGKYFEALKIEKYIEYYKNSPDFHFLLGLIYMNNAQFAKAIESFSECTVFEYGKVEGIISYLPNYNIGVIFEVLGYKEKAVEYYRKCGNYELALKRLNIDNREDCL